jgi:hypothetical protein
VGMREFCLGENQVSSRKSTVIDGPAEPHRGLGRIAAP